MKVNEVKYCSKCEKVKPINDMVPHAANQRLMLAESKKCVPMCNECHLKAHRNDMVPKNSRKPLQ